MKSLLILSVITLATNICLASEASKRKTASEQTICGQIGEMCINSNTCQYTLNEFTGSQSTDPIMLYGTQKMAKSFAHYADKFVKITGRSQSKGSLFVVEQIAEAPNGCSGPNM